MSAETVEQIEVKGSLVINPKVKYDNCEQGTWNVHSSTDYRGKVGLIYLHTSVGIEAAMKLFIWEDNPGRTKDGHIRCTKNAEGRVVGVVVRSY